MGKCWSFCTNTSGYKLIHTTKLVDDCLARHDGAVDDRLRALHDVTEQNPRRQTKNSTEYTRPVGLQARPHWTCAYTQLGLTQPSIPPGYKQIDYRHVWLEFILRNNRHN